MKDLIKSGGYKKGQAVMEYLITYGLALFVILIVLAILVAVVLPSLQAPETCQFTQPGFGCSTKKHVLVADSSDNIRILFQLDNQQGKSVEILDVMCTSAAPANVRKSDVDTAEPSAFVEQMAAGTSKTFGGSASDLTEEVPCYDEQGNRLTLNAGSAFKGTLAVVYKFTEDVPSAPTRLAVATVTGNVQAE
jgi:hypothetical protein